MNFSIEPRLSLLDSPMRLNVAQVQPGAVAIPKDIMAAINNAMQLADNARQNQSGFNPLLNATISPQAMQAGFGKQLLLEELIKNAKSNDGVIDQNEAAVIGKTMDNFNKTGTISTSDETSGSNTLSPEAGQASIGRELLLKKLINQAKKNDGIVSPEEAAIIQKTMNGFDTTGGLVTQNIPIK